MWHLEGILENMPLLYVMHHLLRYRSLTFLCFVLLTFKGFSILTTQAIKVHNCNVSIFSLLNFLVIKMATGDIFHVSYIFRDHLL